jgi:hypothetical protein
MSNHSNDHPKPTPAERVLVNQFSAKNRFKKFHVLMQGKLEAGKTCGMG